MPKDDRVRLCHMLDAAREALAFAKGQSRDTLETNPMLAFSLVRAIEVIEEAASQVSKEYQ